MKRKFCYLGAGMFFGFSLSRVGAAEFDLIWKMFTGEDLKLAWVMLTAIFTGFLGMQLLRINGYRGVDGQPIQIKKKPVTWLNAAGGSLFGIGWGMTGACPGTILAQVGEGKVLGLATLAGIMAGTYAYAMVAEKISFKE